MLPFLEDFGEEALASLLSDFTNFGVSVSVEAAKDEAEVEEDEDEDDDVEDEMDDGTLLLFGPRKRNRTFTFDGSQRDVIISRRRTHRRRGNPASVAAFIMKVMVPRAR